MNAFERVDSFRRAVEGGFVSPGEAQRIGDTGAGGGTAYGVTQATLDLEGRRVLGGAAPRNVRDLTEAQAAEILRVAFWQRPRISALADHSLALALSVYDFGVHSGPGTAVRALQRVIGGLAVDGDLGPVTQARAFERGPGIDLAFDLITFRRAFVLIPWIDRDQRRDDLLEVGLHRRLDRLFAACLRLERATRGVF